MVLSALVTALHFWESHGVLGFGAAVAMPVVLVLLWLWAVVAGRFIDGRTFSIQTAGMVGFGGLTFLCAAVEPRWGLVLAAIGILAHAAWDAYHFRVDAVVNRSWSECCAVLDVTVGVALVVVAVACRGPAIPVVRVRKGVP